MTKAKSKRLLSLLLSLALVFTMVSPALAADTIIGEVSETMATVNDDGSTNYVYVINDCSSISTTDNFAGNTNGGSITSGSYTVGESTESDTGIVFTHSSVWCGVKTTYDVTAYQTDATGIYFEVYALVSNIDSAECKILLTANDNSYNYGSIGSNLSKFSVVNPTSQSVSVTVDGTPCESATLYKVYLPFSGFYGSSTTLSETEIASIQSSTDLTIQITFGGTALIGSPAAVFDNFGVYSTTEYNTYTDELASARTTNSVAVVQDFENYSSSIDYCSAATSGLGSFALTSHYFDSTAASYTYTTANTATTKNFRFLLDTDYIGGKGVYYEIQSNYNIAGTGTKVALIVTSGNPTSATTIYEVASSVNGSYTTVSGDDTTFYTYTMTVDWDTIFASASGVDVDSINTSLSSNSDLNVYLRIYINDSTTPSVGNMIAIDNIGFYGVVAKDSSGNYYSTLQDAITAAGEAATTITLLNDTTEDITIAENQSITLDLNGYTLTNASTHTITNYGTLTIQDSAGGGTVDCVTHACAALYNYGTITEISGGTFTRSQETIDPVDDGTDANSWYTVVNVGTISLISGGTFTTGDGTSSTLGNRSALIRNGDGTTAGTITSITGGTFTGAAVILKNESGSTIGSISGGTFTMDNSVNQWYGGNAMIMNYGTIGSITGGTFNALGTGVRAGETEETATYNRYFLTSYTDVTISDATVTMAGTYNVMFSVKTGVTVCITSGTYTISSDDDSNSLFAVASDASVEISGGTYSSDVSDYVIASMKSSTSDGTTYTVTALEESDSATVASVTSGEATTYYSSLSAAIAAASDGDTVTLLADTTMTANITISTDITLALGDYTVTTGGYLTMIAADADVTITADEGGIKNTNTATGTSSVNAICGVLYVYEGGTLTITGGTYSTCTAYLLTVCGTATVDGASLVSTLDQNQTNAGYVNNRALVQVSGENAKFTFTSGYLNAGKSEGNSADLYGIYLMDGATLVLGSEDDNSGPTIDSVNAAISLNNTTSSPSITVTIYGGTYTVYKGATASSGEKYASVLYLAGDCDVNIYGGTFKNDCSSSTYTTYTTSYNHVISIPYSNTDTNITISGGTFDSGSTDGTVFYVGTSAGSSGSGTLSISISGGDFSDVVAYEYCATGYIPTDADETTGMYTVTQGSYVASVTDSSDNVTYYETLSDALAAASDGSTVKLLADVTVSESLTASTEGTITIDLNGYNLTISEDVTLTVASGTEVVIVDSVSAGLLTNNGTIAIKGTLDIRDLAYTTDAESGYGLLGGTDGKTTMTSTGVFIVPDAWNTLWGVTWTPNLTSATGTYTYYGERTGIFSSLEVGATVYTFGVGYTCTTAFTQAGYVSGTTYWGLSGTYLVEYYKTSRGNTDDITIDEETSTTWTYPTSTGYVFGGWYDKDDKTTVYESTSGIAYAKFVDENVMKVGFQFAYTSSGTTTSTAAEGTTDTIYLRVVSTVDSLNYSAVGFNIYFTSTGEDGNTATYEGVTVSKVYNYIYEYADEYLPNNFSDESQYFSTYVIRGVPTSGYSVVAYAFWVTEDGTTVTSTLTTTVTGESMTGSDLLTLDEIITKGTSSATVVSE